MTNLKKSFEECAASFVGGELVRGSTYRSLHANGTVDQNHVSFAAGVKTVIRYVAAGLENHEGAEVRIGNSVDSLPAHNDGHNGRAVSRSTFKAIAKAIEDQL